MARLDNAKVSIKADIDDKARRQELLSLADEAGKTTKKHVEFLEKIVKEFSALGDRHDTQAADYQPVLEKLRAETEAYQDRIVRHRFAMKGKMTREEWAKAFPAEELKPAKK